MKYTVYFELFGKKMKTTIDADTEEMAKSIIRDKIIFHKIINDFERECDEIAKRLEDILMGKK
jgi:hypothetical protein